MIIVESLFLFILGTAIGSFLNVVIDRLPREESLNGRSHCDYCKHTLSPLDLFPLFSYLFLGGRCRYCKRSLSVQYPLIEALTGILFVTVYLVKYRYIGVELLAYLGIVAVLIAIFITDLKEQVIPDELQIAFIVTALSLKILQGASVLNVAGSVFSGAVVMVPILLLYYFTKGRGMGFGDVKLAFAIGFFTGWLQGLLVLYIGFVLGAVSGIIMIALHWKKMKSKIAFGPYLIMGVAIMMFASDTIFQFIKRLYGF
jgi:leader peptidase (prepilin peptidase) / N-methyltransferase